jgi:hypothetical protein
MVKPEQKAAVESLLISSQLPDKVDENLLIQVFTFIYLFFYVNLVTRTGPECKK